MGSHFAEDEASKAQSRGALIIIEGLDRAGKTTQCATLLQALKDRGHKVKFIRFPGMLGDIATWTLKVTSTDTS